MPADISFASFNLYNFQAAGKSTYSTPVTQHHYDRQLKWTQDMLRRYCCIAEENYFKAYNELASIS